MPRQFFSQNYYPFPLPDLIEIQKSSYEWFLKKGIQDLLVEISPVKDFMERELELYFLNHFFEEPKFDETTCLERNLTYGAALKVGTRLINKKTGKRIEQEIYLGNIPLMTKGGTFIINGIERVVVSQLVRSAGVFFLEENINGRNYYKANIIPERGIWLEFETALNGSIWARINRQRKVVATVLLRIFGYEQNQEIKNLFQEVEKGEVKYIENTLKDDPTSSEEEAILELYKKIRPGELATIDNARSLIYNMFFNPYRYNLGKAGRYKINQKLNLKYNLPEKQLEVLQKDDLVAILKKIIYLNQFQEKADDIDHLSNRRIKAVGELVQARMRVGLMRCQRIIKDRMSTLEPQNLTPSQLVNPQTVISVIYEFFMLSQFSQFMDQTNPLSELEHKRRCTMVGPGGLTRERAGFEVRDVHRTYYGRICPIATPEGQNTGLVNHFACYAKLNEFGFLITPYRKVISELFNKKNLLKNKIVREDIYHPKTKKLIVKAGERINQTIAEKLEKCPLEKIPIKPMVTQDILYLDALEEEKYTISPYLPLDPEGYILTNEKIEARIKGNPRLCFPYQIEFMEVAPQQIISVATSLIPFLEHNDAVRSLMGTNMQRQAVPCLKPEAPIVGTGFEEKVARNSGYSLYAEKDGQVVEVDAAHLKIKSKNGIQTYQLKKFLHSNADTCLNQKVVVEKGQKVKKGDLLVDGPAMDQGELALGQNLLVAFMAWEGGNFEDAILISSRLLKEDKCSSIHIDEHTIDVRETRLGPEIVTRDIPNVSDLKLKELDQEGVVRLGAEVKSGDILVGKISPKGEQELLAEEKLLRAIFGEKSKDVRDTSLYLEHGERGKVIDIKHFSREQNDKLPARVLKSIQVSVADLRKIQVGDKVAGRHGNKGVISKIIPEEDMPFLEDGRVIDIIFNPLSVVSRMNLGQILETHLGLVAKTLNYKVASPSLAGIKIEQIKEELKKANLPMDGKMKVYDGKTGLPFKERITVGYMYVMKLIHLVEDKIHQRSIGPYSLITQQPLGGRAQFGGQRFGEMEVWALEAYGAAYSLQEMLTIKSDDVYGRTKSYESIIKNEEVKEVYIPESFKVLIKELKGLGLNIELLKDEKNKIKK